MTRRRRGSSPALAGPASLPEDEDLLREILLRLSPQPSSLPRASAVCKQWRRLVTDPKFLSSFSAHHHKPPLLGFFEEDDRGVMFTSVMDPPDRIPPDRFDLGACGRDKDVLSCRHGRVLVEHWEQRMLIVCSPITGEQHRVYVPEGFRYTTFLEGTVVCAARDQGHVHNGCHSSPFKVVLIETSLPTVCVYSSETGEWGNFMSTDVPCAVYGIPAVLVGNALYWRASNDGILEFDLDRQSLAVIMQPSITYDILGGSRQIIQAEGGAVGLAILSHPLFQIWQRNVNCHGVATWVLSKSVELHKTLGLPLTKGHGSIMGYSEDADAIFIFLEDNVYLLQLASMQSRKLYEAHHYNHYHPFTSFYTPGIAQVLR